jgi:hypothetical protein
MNHPAKLALIGSALACGALLPQSSQAGGIELYEIATPDVGLASAGYAARAQDASPLFKNPAGMSLLPASQFLPPFGPRGSRSRGAAATKTKQLKHQEWLI